MQLNSLKSTYIKSQEACLKIRILNQMILRALLPAVASASLMFVSSAHSGGFALIEIGASGMGNAYAGASAVSADSSTVWFNPAGMTELENAQFTIAGHVLATDTSFTDRGSRVSTLLGGGPVDGDGSVDIGSTTFIPNLFYTRHLNSKLSYGLGITVPFGSSTEYDDDWTGRYQSVESGVQVIDINPTIAYRINDKVSIGGGISLQLMEATLGSAVDSGAVCSSIEAASDAVPEGTCQMQGLIPGMLATDSAAVIEGDSTGLTFNIAALFKPQESTLLGIAYRHSLDHTIEGDADFDVNPALAPFVANSGLFIDGGAEAEANLPAQLAFSVAHKTSENLQWLADVTWTGWSSIEEIRIVFDNENQPDSPTPLQWEDVLRVSAGVNYKLNNKLTLRGGLAFDQEAIPSPNLRSPRVPGNDRTWISFGAGYNISPRVSLDFGFAHLMLDETPIDNNVLDASGSQVVRGLYDSSVNILSAQFNWNFK